MRVVVLVFFDELAFMSLIQKVSAEFFEDFGKNNMVMQDIDLHGDPSDGGDSLWLSSGWDF